MNPYICLASLLSHLHIHKFPSQDHTYTSTYTHTRVLSAPASTYLNWHSYCHVSPVICRHALAPWLPWPTSLLANVRQLTFISLWARPFLVERLTCSFPPHPISGLQWSFNLFLSFYLSVYLSIYIFFLFLSHSFSLQLLHVHRRVTPATLWHH